MNEAIVLKQYNGMTVTPRDDAIIYDKIIGQNGIITGCDLTSLGAGQIRISAGRGIIKGRQFVVSETTISVELSNSSNLLGRVYIRMDLSDNENPIKILSETADVLSQLETDEQCNYNDGIYEIELGTYTATQLTTENVKKTISTIEDTLANLNKVKIEVMSKAKYSAMSTPPAKTLCFLYD